MNISYFENAEAMSKKAADMVLQEVQSNPRALMCTATGNSPKLLYQILGKANQKQSGLFNKTRVIPLDEWIGLPDYEGSCHAYIDEHILSPLGISKENYFEFDVEAKHLENECQRIQQLLGNEGPMDICILGLGKNGHLGFNEPAKVLQNHCHIAELTLQSQEHSMINDIKAKPHQGITLGLQDILNAKKIILLVSGEGKEEVTKELVSGNISNQCPATLLWKHNNVDCLIVN